MGDVTSRTTIRPLRIGIACHPTFGGSGAVAVDLASALVCRGHEVHLFSYQTPFRLSADSRVHFHQVDVPSYPLFKYPPYAMALASKMAEVAMNEDLHVLHAHYAIPHSIAALLAREMTERAEVKVVTTLHGTDITLVGTEPSYKPATRFAVHRSDHVTAVSVFLAEETRRKVCRTCEIQVIPNFIDTECYRPAENPELRAELGGDEDALLCHASNFRPVKRVQDAIRILAKVNQRRPARLIMVGDGPERPAAEALARELGVADRVLFTGLVPDPLPILQSCDAFLLPSDGESFGLAALEAMACGIPVVGARAGGLPEVVRDDLDGVLEAVGDVEAMGSRLLGILADDAVLERFRKNARARACESFDVRRIVPRYEQVYTT